MKRVLVLLLLVSSYCCNGQNKAKTSHLLFVGNSLTYTNDLPFLVEKEAKKRRVKVKSTMLAYPNYALIDHWDDGNLQSLIASKRFDYVIVQQGPSSQNEGRDWLIHYGKLIGDLSKTNNAKLVYFMVWPSRTYYHTYDDVIKNHRDAAEINNAILCPVGEVWKQYFDETGDFSYYGSDGFHPSGKGSQVAAQVILDTLMNAHD